MWLNEISITILDSVYLNLHFDQFSVIPHISAWFITDKVQVTLGHIYTNYSSISNSSSSNSSSSSCSSSSSSSSSSSRSIYLYLKLVGST